MIETKNIPATTEQISIIEKLTNFFISKDVQQDQLIPVIESSTVALLVNVLSIVLVFVLSWVVMPDDLLLLSVWVMLILLLSGINWLKSLQFKSSKEYISRKLRHYALKHFVLLTLTTFLWGSLSSLIVSQTTLHSVYIVILCGLLVTQLPLLFISHMAYTTQLFVVLFTALLAIITNVGEMTSGGNLSYFLPMCMVLLVSMLLMGSIIITRYFRTLLSERTHLIDARVSIDDLTGLSNHIYFDRALKREWRNAIRRHNELSLILIRIDHFDRHAITDEGYYVNESWEKIVAESIRHLFKRASDVTARYQHGLFAVLLPDTSLQNSHRIADQLRQQIESRHMHYLNNKQAITISASVGAFDAATQANTLFPSTLMDRLANRLNDHIDDVNQVYEV